MGRCHCPGSTYKSWVAKPPSSSSGFLNSISLLMQIKPFWDFSVVCWGSVFAKDPAMVT